MKSLVTLLLAALLLPATAQACDICGLYMGLTPFDNKSSISLYHRYRVFNGYAGQSHYLFPSGSRWFNGGLLRSASSGSAMAHASGMSHHHEANPYDYEAFRVLELRMRWFVHRRLELGLIVPWVANDARSDDAVAAASGLGDISLTAGWHVVVPGQQRWRHRVVVGAGVKLPTGNYYRTDDTGERIDLLLQTGNGMVEGLGWVSWQVARGKWVGTLTAQGKWAARNYYAESYAPGTTLNLMVGRNFGRESGVRWIPQLTLYHEYSAGMKFQGELMDDHRMNALLGGASVDVFWRQLQLSAAVQLPVAQTVYDHPGNAGRITLGLTWNIQRSLRLF